MTKKCPSTVLTLFAWEIVQKHYPQYIHNYVLEPFSHEGEFGVGGLGTSLIYFLSDPDGKLLCVLKGCTLLDEELPIIPYLLPACSLLQKLPISLSKFIFPFATSTYTLKGKHYIALAIPAAEGHSITHHMAAAVGQPRGSQLHRQMVDGIMKTAMALGELHTLSPDTHRPISQECIKLEDNVILRFLNLMDMQPNFFPISAASFRTRFASFFQTAHTVPFPSGYIHGDSNITNIFYEPSNGSISFIDSMTIFHTIDNHGFCCGNIASDYTSCRFSIDLYGYFYGYSKEERDELDALFVASYRLKTRGKEPIPIHIQYYRVYLWMCYGAIYLLKASPKTKKKLMSIFQYCIQNLLDALPPE